MLWEREMERIIPTSFLVSPSLAAEEGWRSTHGLSAAVLPGGNLHIHGVDCGGVSPTQIGCSTVFPVLNQAGFGYLAEDPTFFMHNHLLECRSAVDPRLRLKAPKLEPGGRGIQSGVSWKHDLTDIYHLPDLRSLDPVLNPADKFLNPPLRLRDDVMSLIESSQKRFRPSSMSSPLHQPPPPLLAPPPAQGGAGSSRPAMPASELARRRRKSISDRTRILESLVPGEKRMGTGSMLAEAHKYVKFLEAQVTALQSMPCASAWRPLPLPAGRAAACGGLEKLSRQQLLQVMMYSPVVQDLLYKRGWCVFSAEQVAALGQALEQLPQLSRAPPPPG